MTVKKYYPEIAVAAASAAWGLFWIPLRAFAAAGLTGVWAVFAQFSAPLIILLPFALRRALIGKPTGFGQYRSGILVGAAVSLYLESLLLTDVARSLILFYVMPAWATLIEFFILRKPISRLRAVSLLLGLAGMALIIIKAGTLSVALNAGDLIALVSGVLFSFGALNVRTTRETALFEQVFAFFLFSSLASFLFMWLPLPSAGAPPSPTQLGRFAPWLLLAAGGFLIPVMSGVYWGSRHVDPGRLGILLQTEAIVGILSAALFAGEPFGLRQAVGAACVVGAGFIEVAANRGSAPSPTGARTTTGPSA